MDRNNENENCRTCTETNEVSKKLDINKPKKFVQSRKTSESLKKIKTRKNKRNKKCLKLAKAYDKEEGITFMTNTKTRKNMKSKTTVLSPTNSNIFNNSAHSEFSDDTTFDKS